MRSASAGRHAGPAIGVGAIPFAVAAGIGAVGAIGGGLIAADASKSSAKTIASANREASQVEQNQFNQTQQNLSPFLGAGTNALTQLQSALGIGPGGNGQFNTAGFTGSPGYQFQLGQQIQAVQNSAARQGGVNSGNTLKALSGYSQGLAAQDWQKYLGNLNSLVNTGQSAANQTGNFGAAAAGQIGQNTINAGAAIGAGTIGSANALAGGLNGLSQTALNYAFATQSPWLTPNGGQFIGGNDPYAIGGALKSSTDGGFWTPT